VVPFLNILILCKICFNNNLLSESSWLANTYPIPVSLNIDSIKFNNLKV
jgi:hypothetical protein